MAETHEKGNAATAFVVGALLGAGVALLFAPQSGRRTRRDIRVAGEKAKNKAEAALIDLRRSFENLVDDVSERLEEEVDRGKEWTESKIADVQRVVKTYFTKENRNVAVYTRKPAQPAEDRSKS